MSALAKYLLSHGYTVSGSDIAENGNVAELKKLGAKVYPKHTSNAVRGADAVVYTSAINFDNPELKYATKKKIPLFKRSQLLGHIVEKYSQSIAVSGSHGKTTATAMIAIANEKYFTRLLIHIFPFLILPKMWINPHF